VCVWSKRESNHSWVFKISSSHRRVYIKSCNGLQLTFQETSIIASIVSVMDYLTHDGFAVYTALSSSEFILNRVASTGIKLLFTSVF
jgi:hypothetical protein